MDLEKELAEIVAWWGARYGAARWQSSQDGSDEQMFGAKQQAPLGGSGD